MPTAPGEALSIAGFDIEPGSVRDVELLVSQSYSGSDVVVPIRVVRAPDRGPVVVVTAAVHGDELNGTGIIRRLLLAPPFELKRGTLVLVPVVNVLALEQRSRYLPDRRDLNRCFPGRPQGSQASRFAHALFSGVILRCDFGIDLHSAAMRRTNFPNVRGDLSDPEIHRIAKAFGCPLVVNKRGAPGMLRREASRRGCPTILLEAGEVWKIEPAVVEIGLRGIRNVLVELEMIEGERQPPAYQARADRTVWVRADAGGLVEFHVGPGDLVSAHEPIATVSSLLGTHPRVQKAPVAGVVLGLSTLPTVSPGDPLCHLAIPRGGLARIRRALHDAPRDSLHERLRQDLATNITLSAPGEGSSRS